MKQVVSISLGSSKRNGTTTASFGGQEFHIRRIGTDGNKTLAARLIRELDGRVDAIGLGGTDLYIYAGNRRYTFRESAALAANAKVTPVVDGSAIKNTLERRVIPHLITKHGLEFAGQEALIVCAVDRFGLAEALVSAGSHTVFGDLMFGLGLPIPITSLNGLSRLANVVAPVITQLPVSLFYPTGDKQTQVNPKFASYFHKANVIAGDFHFIRRYMPDNMKNKLIITNTVTTDDEMLLKERGIATLVTTTPEMGGRSFGTNILEGVLTALSGKRPEQMTVADYTSLIEETGIEPRIKKLT
ncbi:quinate 5-dehydrogenase [Sporomusa aerivorans]|uniref:quinate 5-dehydrogenase n=1 Tax=Sporomusa aerivorans TaxID=204936 RepID=UPI00352B240A